MNEFEPVDMMVNQVKGNAAFLKNLLFGRASLVALAIVAGLFLIAAIAIN